MTPAELRVRAQEMANSLAVSFFIVTDDAGIEHVRQHGPGQEFVPRKGSVPQPMGGSGAPSASSS
jgi:hypothetical protein